MSTTSYTNAATCHVGQGVPASIVIQQGRRTMSDAGETEGSQLNTPCQPPKYRRTSVNTPLIRPHVRKSKTLLRQ